MSEHEPEGPPPPAQPVLLYRPPEAPEAVTFTEPSVSAGCFTAGFFILAGTLLALVGFKIMHASARDNFRTLGFVFALPAAIGVGMLKTRRWRPFGSGLLIGVGVAMVFGGMCLWGSW
jgi:hypothetical protein